MPIIQHIAVIHFDFGAARQLAPVLGELGVRRPLLVTDRGVRAAGAFDRATDSVPEPRVTFDATPPHPDEAAVDAALALYRDAGCDGVVAVGGGSAMDCGKAIALLATHEGPLGRYAVGPGAAPIGAPAPLVAIPTTAGTSSEIGRGMAIVLRDGTQAGFISRNLVPKVAICDPELTLSLPAAVTAGTGMDAFVHCLEGFVSPAVNPPAEAVALDGLRRIAANIERVVHEPQDRQARWEMMMGAVEAGMAMWKGLGTAHAMSIPMECLPLHHGTLVGVLLPEAVAHLDGALGGKADAIRDALGLPPGADLPDHLRRLNARIGLPPDLAAMGVPRARLPEFAEGATRTFFNESALRPASSAQYLAMLERAMGEAA